MYAAIFSQCVPAAEISAALSLPATEEKEKGAVMPGGRRTYDEHRWYYHPSVPDCLDFETKLKHLLNELPADKVQSLPEDCKVSINVAYYEYQDSPGGWHLESDILKKLAVLGIDLDVDLYLSGPPLPE